MVDIWPKPRVLITLLVAAHETPSKPSPYMLSLAQAQESMHSSVAGASVKAPRHNGLRASGTRGAER